jgi:hypothetical protein
MKSSIRFVLIFAFLAAIPIEAINFFAFPYPVDVGLPENASWLVKLVGYQWIFLHFPGFYVADWFENRGFRQLGYFSILFCGYIETSLMLIAGIFTFQWFHRWVGKFWTKRITQSSD